MFTTQTASGWLLDQLTGDGRVPFRLACGALTPWESILVQHVLGRADVELWPAYPDRSAYANEPGPPASGWRHVRVTTATLSGVALWRPGEEPAEPAQTLGWLRVPPQVLDMVAEEARMVAVREAAELREIDAVILEWDACGELERRVTEIADWVERVETVYVLIGRDVFSKSDAGSNTLTREGLLENLRNRSPEIWRPAERLFVVAGHCLFRSGRSVRFEEFNGRQLSATALRQFLVDRYASYCAAAGRDPMNLHGAPLLELADRVRELMLEVDVSPWMRYRRINGLTFVKNEYLADFPLPRDPEQMPELVAEHGRVHLGVAPSGDVRADVRAMALAAAALDADGAGPRALDADWAGPRALRTDRADPTSPEVERAGPTALDADRAGPAAVGTDGAGPPAADGGAIGELLAAIVLSAIAVTDSDYGMSSSVRDLARLRGARPGGPDGVLAMKKADFFCCCLPHVTRMGGVPDEEMVPILWRAAQRMMYNRWHFAPGEFDRAAIPAKRHYFFPPQVPDIAEHGEHRHGGHVASRVRFSIRAPGAQVWLPPFRVFGHGFRGCYDIRLVRMEGPAYAMAELRDAVRHCSLIDEVWRTLATGVEHGAFPVPPVRGFDRAWYESRGWERLRPHAIARGAMAGAAPA